ncbi:unnamed protein product, partial [Mesorhabditis spiculigera]
MSRRKLISWLSEDEDEKPTSDLESPFCRRTKSFKLRPGLQELDKPSGSHEENRRKKENHEDSKEEFLSASEGEDSSRISEKSVSPADNKENKPDGATFHAKLAASPPSNLSSPDGDLKYLESLRSKNTRKELEDVEEDSLSEDESSRGNRRRRTNSFVVEEDEDEYESSFIDDEDDSEEVLSSGSEVSVITDDEEIFTQPPKEEPAARNHATPAKVKVVSNLTKMFASPSVMAKKRCEKDHFLMSLSLRFQETRHFDADKYLDKGFKEKLPTDLSITWNPRLRKTAGFCRLRKKIMTDDQVRVLRTVSIELSTKVITTAERLRDTLIHEMCHAAVFLIDKLDKEQHGPIWRGWARECMSRHPSLPFIDRCHNYEIEAKYVYRCEGCGQEIRRHSKSFNVQRHVCGICRGHFKLEVLSHGVYKRRSLTTNAEPKNPFAAFVKANYGSVKNGTLKHKEVMSILSAKWKEERAKQGLPEEPKQDESSDHVDSEEDDDLASPNDFLDKVTSELEQSLLIEGPEADSD